MDNKLLLAKGITLLFRESQLAGPGDNSASLVRELIGSIKLSDVNLGIDHERDILTGLKNTALTMCDMPPGHQFELMEILQRTKINCGEDTGLYDAIRSGVEPELSEQALKRTCLNIKQTLMNHFRERKVNEIIGKYSYKMKFEREAITNMNQFVSELCAQLEPYQVEAGKKDPAVISDVDMSDTDAVSKVFSEIKSELSGEGILQTGFQGMNRMLDGGFRRGEEWVIGALQHNYKTGFSLTLFKQIALYNKPVLKDPTKKPLLLRISFEDSLLLNFQFLYTSLKENETGQKVVLDGISEDEMARYVYAKLSVAGYHTRFMYVNPSMWTYRDICNKVLELEAEGYEVHMVMLDYLLKIPTTGCDQGPHGHDIRNMYERMRNFMSARGITLLTPHQLSTDAKQMIRDGRTSFVKELVGRGYYAGCKQLDQVVDGELFIHIEIVNGESWLTIQRGKHRKIAQTPLEHQYCVLKFEPVGALRDDVRGADTTRKKVGGGPIGSGEENPFWDFNDAI